MSRPKLKRWQWIALGLAVFTAISWFVHLPDSHARELNRAIAEKSSPLLKNYPYEFRVLRTEGSVAIMTTPRSFVVPAFRMLGALYPEMEVKNPNAPAFIAAQKTLGEVQGEVRGIVMSQPGITSVRWELDRQWLSAHGIEVPVR